MFNDEYRHTSLLATLRKTWDLGQAFTQRDASARTFDDLFTLETPRDPETWATVTALPVPAWHLDEQALGNGLSGLGKSMGHGIIEHARELGLELPSRLDDPAAVDELDLAQYLPADGVAVVEWPERAGEVWPEDRIDITLTIVGEARRATIETYGRCATAPA